MQMDICISRVCLDILSHTCFPRFLFDKTLKLSSDIKDKDIEDLLNLSLFATLEQLKVGSAWDKP